MAKKVLTDLDLNKNELQNAAIQNLSAAPSNPVEGQVYYNTGDKISYQWVGNRWVPLGGDPAANAVTVEEASGGTYLKKYVVKQNGAQVGVTIDIPKDMVVQSGSIVTGTWNNNVFTEDATQPGTGPDKALKLTVANQTAPIYINVADLVDAYTAGTGISISAANAISIEPATASALGGVKIGANITIANGGTISISSSNIVSALGAQQANKVFAGPTSGSSANPTFRSLVANDIPALAYAKTTSIGNPALTSSNGVCVWTISNIGVSTKDCNVTIMDGQGDEVMCEVKHASHQLVITINSDSNIAASTYFAIITGMAS